MLALIVRRILWAVPCALGIALLAFFALSQLPADSAPATDSERERRGLPMFLNAHPRDLRARVDATTALLLSSSEGSVDAEIATTNLVRLGGAALPLVVPAFDALGPVDRTRVATALARLAVRMGLPDAETAREPREAVRYWRRYWEARGDDFRGATARNRAHRLAQYGTESRAKELYELDTFALPAVFELLPDTLAANELQAARVLVDVLAHVTERDDRIDSGASVTDALACIDRWHSWWIDAQLGLVTLRGFERITAFGVETRFGRWALHAMTVDLGRRETRARHATAVLGPVRVTLTVLGIGWLTATIAGVALATWRARRSGPALERSVGLVALAPCAVTLLVTGSLLSELGARTMGSTGAAGVALGLTMLPAYSAHLRPSVAAALGSEQVQAALARGASSLRATYSYALRGPLVTLLAKNCLALPGMLTASFVLERVFALEGLGAPLLAAVARGEVGLPIALMIATATWSTLVSAMTDVAICVLDPRMLPALARAERRA
ncbi:MAG: ABC transporter permease subunit [Myxococcales bacterium]|nr:ABC transporter permease subunit [Myxococcales bacterium]